MLRTYRRAWEVRTAKNKGQCFRRHSCSRQGPRASQIASELFSTRFPALLDHARAASCSSVASQECLNALLGGLKDAPMAPRECPGAPEESKIMPRSNQSHFRPSKVLFRTLPETQNCDFMKIDVLLSKNLGFRRYGQPEFVQKWLQTLPNEPQNAKKCILKATF